MGDRIAVLLDEPRRRGTMTSMAADMPRHSRRTRLARVGAAIAMAATLELAAQHTKGVGSPPAAAAYACAPVGPRGRGPASAARAAQASLLTTFCRGGVFRDSTGAMTSIWPVSQALSATLSVAALTPPSASIRRQIQGGVDALVPYWNGHADSPAYVPHPQSFFSFGATMWYDDNAWLGLDLVRSYRATGDGAALERAKQIFGFEAAGWQASGGYRSPGGVFWNDSADTRSRNAVSTAGAAQLALNLYLATGSDHYLAFARHAITWVEKTLRAPNGLFYDNIASNGEIDRHQWSYNQGLMLGAYALLHQATHRADSLERARQIARASLAELPLTASVREPPIFNAIYFQNLMYVDTFGTIPGARGSLRAYTSWLDRQVDTPTGVVRSGKLLDQAALVQCHATLAMSPAQLVRLWGPAPVHPRMVRSVTVNATDGGPAMGA